MEKGPVLVVLPSIVDLVIPDDSSTSRLDILGEQLQAPVNNKKMTVTY